MRKKKRKIKKVIFLKIRLKSSKVLYKERIAQMKVQEIECLPMETVFFIKQISYLKLKILNHLNSSFAIWD